MCFGDLPANYHEIKETNIISTAIVSNMALTQLIIGPAGLTILAVSVVLYLAKLLISQRRHGSLPLPPGPPGEPILGHVRVIPAQNPENAYIQWSKKYSSDILSFKMLNQPVIILNSARAAVDLLDKRGSNYCDRPRFAAFEAMGWGKTLTFLRWGADFRMHRKILQTTFQKSKIPQYRPLQQREVTRMLQGILDQPTEWDKVLRRFATAIVLGIGFGVRIDKADSPYIQMASDASYAVGNSGPPGGTLIDFFPFLCYLPSWLHVKSLKFALDWKWAVLKIHDKPYDAVVTSTEKKPCLINTLLDQRRSQMEKGMVPDLGIDDIKGTAGAVFAAGQDTTWSTLVIFVLAMMLYPDVQEKARRSIDDAIGRDRLPNFADRPKLEYLDYVVYETLRWLPVTPLGVPHKSLKDDVYDGYSIPAGSVIFANAKAMMHDERVYSDPKEFHPERFMPVDQGGRGEPLPNGQFGFGRRICPGNHLAEASVWVVAANMLSTMKIEKAVDAEGNEVNPKIVLTSGLTSHPRPFPCRVAPRDGKSLEVIMQAAL